MLQSENNPFTPWFKREIGLRSTGIFGRGWKVKKVDAGSQECDLERDGQELKKVRWMTSRKGVWHPPQIGELVTVINETGHGENAMIAFSVVPDSEQPSVDDREVGLYRPDGAVFRYFHKNDDGEGLLELNLSEVQGVKLKIILPDSGEVEIEAKKVSIAADVEIDGKLTVTGDIEGGADVSDAAGTIQDNREKYNQHKHPVSGATTLLPNPLQEGGG